MKIKYRVSFGWDLGCDQMITDFTKTFNNRDEAELFQSLIWQNNTKEYTISSIDPVNP
jgi:hypothetical protein